MTDNVAVTPGTGATIATDDVSGVQYQRVKLDLGGDGLTVPVVTSLPVSLDGTDVVDNSSNANGSFTLTMPSVATKRNYVAGFEISGSGATSASSQYAILTGCSPFPMYYHMTIPAGVATTTILLSVQFTRPLPASAVTQAVTLFIPAFGTGNTLQAAILHGFYK